MGIVTVVKIGMTKFCIMKSDKGTTLIDTVPETYSRKFFEALKKNSVEVNDICAIVLTHHHGDHTGMVSAVLKMNPRIRLIFHHKEEQALASGKNQISFYRSRTIEKISVKHAGKDRDFYPILKRENDLIVEEDRSDLLRSLGIEADLILTPGHTSGSISVLFSNGTLVAGDTFGNVSINPFKFNPFPFVYDDKEALLRSWKLLYSLKPKTVIPSHGKAFDIGKITLFIS